MNWKQLHPLAQINFFPRIIAAYSFVLLAALTAFDTLIVFPNLVIAIIGFCWPFLALLASKKWKTKRTELINMHLDAVFSTVIFLVAPAPLILFVVTLVLIANATFVGSLRMAASTIATISITLIVGHVIHPIHWLEVDTTSQVIMLAFSIFYITLFAFKGYQLVQKVINLNKTIFSLSNTDPLTGCYNRLYLDSHLPNELNKSRRINYPVSVIFADLDHFKLINDKYGHAAGDEVLKEFIKLAYECIRTETDWVARFGGEEFILVLANANLEQSEMVAERIRQRVASHEFVIDGKPIPVTCSFGVSSVCNPGEEVDAQRLLRAADKALYRSKEAGRNCVQALAIEERSQNAHPT